MNRKQWGVFAWGFLLLGLLFIGIDSLNNNCFNLKLELSLMNMRLGTPIQDNLDFADVWCVVNSEIYEPFIYISYFLWIVFLICGWLEPKEKNK